MQTGREKKPELRLSRVFDAPRSLVWEAWSKAEYVKRWFTPAPLTTPRCEVDLRTGGIFCLVMKMPDGGFRPAFNVEVATDVTSGLIVGVDVINQGSDAGQAVPMEKQVVQRLGTEPGAYLVDGGFAQRETITTLTKRGVTVYAPVRPPRTTTSKREKATPRNDDTEEVEAWRKRMDTDDAQAIYRLRAATAEWANAQLRQHGLLRFSVRGLAHVRTVAVLAVITHNLLRWIALRAA